MRRVIWFACSIIVVIGIAFLDLGQPPVRASAGGFPCFLCHGVNFEGSDIAPAVAGTQLTDEEIVKQMRSPRGVMPAFGPNDWPDPQTAISYIRAQAAGKPTLALSPQQKSAALAMIAGVAAARATEYARLSQQGTASRSLPISPTPVPQAQSVPPSSAEYARLAGSVAIESPTPASFIPFAASPPTPTASAASADASPGFGTLAALGGFLLAIMATVRFWIKR